MPNRVYAVNLNTLMLRSNFYALDVSVVKRRQEEERAIRDFQNLWREKNKFKWV